MALISFASVSGSPGITSTLVGLTRTWPRPVILVEADIAKASSILPGYLRGQVDHSRGLTPISILSQRGQLTPRAIQDQAVPLGDNKRLLPGLSNLTAAAAAGRTFWNSLGENLAAYSGQGADVLVDLGRLGIRDDRDTLLQLADLVVLVARPTLPDIAAIRDRVDGVRQVLTQVGREKWLGLLLIDSPDGPYRDSEIAKALGVPVIARIAHDPRSAAVDSVGAEATSKTTKSARSRDLTLLPNVLEQTIRQHRDELGTIPSQERAS